MMLSFAGAYGQIDPYRESGLCFREMDGPDLLQSMKRNQIAMHKVCMAVLHMELTGSDDTSVRGV